MKDTMLDLMNNLCCCVSTQKYKVFHTFTANVFA